MKYIVYKTTNIINNYIYIGVHKTEDPNIFDGYIGCGVNIKHINTYDKAKTKFQQAVKQFGTNNFKREVLAIYNTPEEAYLLEETLVNEDFLQRKDVYNMVLGGVNSDFNGILVFRYTLKGDYDKSYRSYEQAARELNVQASSIRRAVIYKYKVKDYYFSTDKLSQIDLCLYRKTNNKKIIYRYKKSGEYDATFYTQESAAKDSNLSSSTINRIIQLGYCSENGYYFSTVYQKSYDKARSLYIKTRQVFKYNSNGEYLCSYNTQEEAEKDNPGSNITKAIKLKEIDNNGYIWGLVKLKNYNNKSNKSRKVAQYDNNGTMIKTWVSGKACCKEVGASVQNVLSGKNKTYKGYVYKYID